MNAVLIKRNFDASLRLMDRARAASTRLKPLSEIHEVSDLVTRARIVRSELNARALFQGIHRRSLGLTEALARLRQRKRTIYEK
jgi:hypothetical protein